MAILIDELFGRLGYKHDPSGLRQFERGIAKARARLDRISALAIKVGGAITAAAIAPIVTFAKYETEMAKIEGLVGISRDQIAAWQGDIADIAKATGIGPDKLAESLFFVTSAGYRGSAAMDILEKSAKGAAAGMGDADEIADLLTSAIGVYGEGVLTAEQATDQLTSAIREGKLEPRELGPALSGVLPFAEALGVSFGETAGALASMSRQGINARRGATGLRGVLSKLIKPTEAGKKALAEMGLTYDDIRKEIEEKGLLSALRTLRTAFGDDSEALGKVFEDQEALLAVLALTGPKVLENAEIIDKVTKATGTLDEALLAQTETIKFQWNVAMAMFKSILIDIGRRLKPTAEKVLDFAKAALEWFNDLTPAMKDMVAQVLAAGPAILALGVALKGLSFALGGFVPIARGVGMAAGLLVASVGRSSKGIRTGFAKTWLAVKGGATAAFVAMETAAVVSFAAIKRGKRRLDATLAFGGVRGVLATVFDPFRKAGIAAYAAVGEAARLVVSPITGAYAAVKKHGVFGLMQAAAVAAYAGIRWAAIAAVSPITGVYAAVKKHGVFGAMQVAAVTAFAGIKVAAMALQTSLVTVFGAVMRAAALMWVAIGGPVGLAIAAVVLAVIAAWKPLSTFFSGLAGGIKGGSGKIGDAFDKLLDALGPVGEGIRSVFSALGDVWTWLINLFGDQSDEGKSWGEAIVDGIVAAIEAITDLVNWFKDLWALLEAAPGNAFGWIGREFRAAMAGLEALVPDWARSIFGLDDEASDAKASGVGMMGAVGEGIDSGKGAAVGAVENVAEEMRDFFGSSDAKRGPLSDITAAGRSIIETLAKGVRQAEPLRAALTAGALALPPTADLLANLPVGPPIARQSAFGGERGATTISVNIGQGAIVIHAPGGDPREIAAALGSEMLRESMRALSEEIDSVIES